jgi:allantoicase
MEVQNNGIDLVCERVGGSVLWANDEFFAPKENLLKAAEPVWKEGVYTERGKWMDGWESRRRRTPGHDSCIVRIGLPGIPRSVVVDTRFFRGNFPESCSIEACEFDGHPDLQELEDESNSWTEVLATTRLEGDCENRFEISCDRRFTHLRLHIYPDGGVARLRLFGDVVMDPAVVRRGGQIDLASIEHGAQTLACSDAFYGSPNNLLLPDRGVNMGDGWETRRRRSPGYDWVVVALAGAGVLRRVEVDTNHFKGNFPESFSLDGVLVDDTPADWSDVEFHPIIARAKLQAHTRHQLEVDHPGPISHVRLCIHPDGGVSRLRVWGELVDEARICLQLRHLNSLSSARAVEMFLSCCGASRWAQRMSDTRAFGELDEVHSAASAIWADLDPTDWLEAFDAHPKIGERHAKVSTGSQASKWSQEEQAAVDQTAERLLEEIADGNQRYLDKFGFIFIVYATGETVESIHQSLFQRLDNDLQVEIRIAAEEQRKITANRLEKWFR